MKLAIVTATYRKKDGSTKEHLSKVLESVSKQIHTDYKMFLVGDKYDDNEEFINLSKIIDSNRIWTTNLPIAYERSKYRGRKLWVSGGVFAMNTGINEALNQGFDYICHLDHDDVWNEDHLKVISEAIEKTGANFLSTRCTKGWPAMESIDYLTKWRPLPNKIFKSTTCVNHRHFNNIVFRNMVEECNKVYAADADMWMRINKMMTVKNEWGIVINESTMHRLDSQAVLKKPNIV